MKICFSRLLSLSLVVMLILPIFSVNVKAGNNWDNAMAIELDETVVFNNSFEDIGIVDKHNYYIFEPDTTGIYSINFAALNPMSNADAELAIYDENDNRVWFSKYRHYFTFGMEPGIRDEIKLTAGKCYFIKATTSFNNGYAFKIRKVSKYYNTLDIGNDGRTIVSGIRIGLDQEIKRSESTYYYKSEGSYAATLIYKIKTTDNPGSTYNFSLKGTRTKESNEYRSEDWTSVRIFDENYKQIYFGEIYYKDDNLDLSHIIELRHSSTFYVLIRDGDNAFIDNDNDRDDSRDFVFSFSENINTEKPGKPSITSLTGGKGSLTVQYSTVKNGVSFYQIAYKKYGAKKWSYVTVSSLMQSKLITGLSRNQKYSVMVRAIKKVNGEKYVGAWSTAKQVKTK